MKVVENSSGRTVIILSKGETELGLVYNSLWNDNFIFRRSKTYVHNWTIPKGKVDLVVSFLLDDRCERLILIDRECYREGGEVFLRAGRIAIALSEEEAYLAAMALLTYVVKDGDKP